MNKKVLSVVAVIIIVAAVIGLVTMNKKPSSQNSTTNTTPPTSTSTQNSTGQSQVSQTPANSSEAQETNMVQIKDFAFTPAVIKVKKGTTVTWTNNDTAPHTVTGSGGLSSGTLDSGKSYTFTFNSAGTFNYVCSFHSSMHGQVIVE